MEKRIVLIGAGSAQFGNGTPGDVFSTVDLLDTMLELQSDYLGYIQ